MVNILGLLMDKDKMPWFIFGNWNAQQQDFYLTLFILHLYLLLSMTFLVLKNTKGNRTKLSHVTHLLHPILHTQQSQNNTDSITKLISENINNYYTDCPHPPPFSIHTISSLSRNIAYSLLVNPELRLVLQIPEFLMFIVSTNVDASQVILVGWKLLLTRFRRKAHGNKFWNVDDSFSVPFILASQFCWM